MVSVNAGVRWEGKSMWSEIWPWKRMRLVSSEGEVRC